MMKVNTQPLYEKAHPLAVRFFFSFLASMFSLLNPLVTSSCWLLSSIRIWASAYVMAAW